MTESEQRQREGGREGGREEERGSREAQCLERDPRGFSPLTLTVTRCRPGLRSPPGVTAEEGAAGAPLASPRVTAEEGAAGVGTRSADIARVRRVGDTLGG